MSIVTTSWDRTFATTKIKVAIEREKERVECIYEQIVNQEIVRSTKYVFH